MHEITLSTARWPAAAVGRVVLRDALALTQHAPSTSQGLHRHELRKCSLGPQEIQRSLSVCIIWIGKPGRMRNFLWEHSNPCPSWLIPGQEL